MQLDSQLVGTALRPHRLQLNGRRLMNYAAAVGDSNPVYFDDERTEGITGHPMFATAVTWRICKRLEAHLAPERLPPGILTTQLHYSEHLQFYRPFRAAQDLTIQGRIAAILPHRAGVRFVIRFDAVDADLRPIFTEHSGALLRGVRCTDSGRGVDGLPEEGPPPSGRGPIWEAKLPIDTLLPYVYDGCTGIHFPIHTSPKFAHAVGLPGTIVQGTAILALAVRELIDREADGNPLRLRSVQCRFGGMVLPGSRVRFQCLADRRHPDGREIHFQILNDRNQGAVRRGKALLEPG
jgi:acyl dehydratase